MRVGIFDPYLDDIGGGEKYMMTIASVLAKHHTVDVFWDHPADLELIGERFNIAVTKFHIVPNIFRSNMLVRFFTTRKYDAIVFLSDGSIPFVGTKKLFVHIQQPLDHFQNQSFFDKLKLSRVRAFFCNSTYTKSFVTNAFGITAKIIYPPVAVHKKQVKKENVILHVGRFRVKNVKNGDYKKQMVMVEAFKTMVDKGFKGWKFVVAVSFSDKEKEEFSKMEHAAKGYPIEFLINQTNEKLWDVYSQAKIYWHASGFGENLEIHPEFAEHFGISTVEAMGAGAVPVVINAGGQREIVQEGKNGFLWDTLDGLMSKTKILTEDEKLWQRLSKEAEQSAKLYSYETFEKNIKELIR